MSAQEPPLDPLLVLWRTMLLYGGLLFAAGFVFGVARELVLIPMLGRTAGRLGEFTIMLVVTFALALKMARRVAPASPGRLLALGVGGAVVLAAIEAMFVLYVAQLPAAVYWKQFDVPKGELFVWALLAVVVAPWLAARLRRA